MNRPQKVRLKKSNDWRWVQKVVGNSFFAYTNFCVWKYIRNIFNTKLLLKCVDK